MRRSPLVVLLLAALTAHAAPLAAQGPLFVRAVDSATSSPIVRALAYIGPVGAGMSEGSWRWGGEAVAGLLRIDSVPAGRHRLIVGCAPAHARIGSIFLPPIDTAIADSMRDTLVVRFNAADCDQRPLHADTVTIRGWLQFGFEHSRFVPCPAQRRLLREELGSPSRDDWITVVLPDSVSRDARSWPRGAAREGYTEWAAHVTGVLEGPGRYGHLSASSHRLGVLVLHELQRPVSGWCDAS